MKEINMLLLVEDDDGDAILTRRKIERSHLPVREFLFAKSVKDAKEILGKHAIDILFLDLNLLDSRGLDTLREIRPIFSGVLIVLTSIGDEQTGIDSIRLGADDYLVKNALTEDTLRKSLTFAMTRFEVRQASARADKSLEALSKIGR